MLSGAPLPGEQAAPLFWNLLRMPAQCLHPKICLAKARPWKAAALPDTPAIRRGLFHILYFPEKP